MNPENAFNNRNPSNADLLSEAHELVTAFCSFSDRRRAGLHISDIRLLPAPKIVLEAAFRLVIATEPRATIRRRLVGYGEVLARYQAGVRWDISLSPGRMSGSVRKEPSPATLSERQLDRILSRVSDDGIRLSRLFQAAERDARRRYPDNRNVRPPMSEDGTYTWHGHIAPIQLGPQ